MDITENIKNAIDIIKQMSDLEKEAFIKLSRRELRKGPLKYDNPVTTEKDLSDLRENLLNTTIDFIKERNLSDIDAISFQVDGLDWVINNGYSPVTSDSSIVAEGLQNTEKGMAHKLIGEYL